MHFSLFLGKREAKNEINTIQGRVEGVLRKRKEGLHRGRYEFKIFYKKKTATVFYIKI